MRKYFKKQFIFIVGIIIFSVVLLNSVYHKDLIKRIKEVNIKTLANLPYDTNDYVYLSDLTWLDATSSWKDSRALKKDENESGGLISLLVDKEVTYFLKGIFAHAYSTVIYSIPDNNYDTFESYLGVDSSRNSNGNGVKFYIYVSDDNEHWTLKKETETLKGNSDAVKATIDITNAKYLKLVADYLNNQDSDHAVYADAKFYNSSTYKPKETTKVDYIKDVTEYDTELSKNSTDDIIFNNSNLELELLRRNLVKNVTYPIIQALATSDEYKKEAIEWLFNDKEALKLYTTGGEPLGNYVKSLTILSNLYHTYKDDLDGPHKDVFLKMMMAISLTHSGTIAFWTSGANNTLVLSDPIKRYEVFKNLYLHENLPAGYEDIAKTFNADVFESLTVEEMRWVVDARLSDEELPWLNWYSSNLTNTKYNTDGKTASSMNPYTYIWYNASFKWAYTDENYYNEAPNFTYCAPDIKTPTVDGYVRNTNCNSIYHTKEWGIKSDTNTQPRLWVIWEEDGVCGALSKTGENLNNSYGQVAAVTRQPGHAAYLIQNKKKNEDGTFDTTWSIGNDVHGWAKSSGTEKGERLPLNWGTTTLDYSSDYNASYVILAQRAIDDFANYEKALEYKLLADIYENEPEKQEALYRDIVNLQSFNLDGWYGLIKTYLRNETKTPEDYNNLANEIMNKLKEFPLPMYDMIKLLEGKLNESEYGINVQANLNDVLTELSQVQNNNPSYKQAQAVRQVAEYLLGQQEEAVKFSFDGENANKIVLNTEKPPKWEYSLDYSYDAPQPGVEETEEERQARVHATWTEVDGNVADLTNVLDKITVDKDIVIHLGANDDRTPTSQYVFIINIEKDKTPTNLYANDLENKVIGVTDTMEWQIVSKGRSTNNWTKFSEEEPDLSKLTTILVREGAHDTYLPSDSVEFTFEADPEADLSKVYIPISRLSATASTYEKEAESPSKAIDGHNKTMWHTKWNGSDNEKSITIHIDGGAEISKLDYMPRQDGSPNGRITKAKIETSLDGETWTLIDENIEWANDSSTKSYFFINPTRAYYVRLTGLETQGGNYASAAMINLYENKNNKSVDINTLSVSYMQSGYTYNGSEHTPSVTVKEGNTELIPNEQYAVSYSNNINAGTGNITITGVGIYNGTVTKTFTISKAKSPEHEPIDYLLSEEDDKTLGDITLPDGWNWEKPETILESGRTITAKAIYDDRNNYENYTKQINVTKIVGLPPQFYVTKDAEDAGYEIDYEHYKLALTLDYDNADDKNKNLEYFKSLLDIYDYEDEEAHKEVKVSYESDLIWEIGTYHIYVTATDSDNNETTLDIEISITKDGVTKDITNYDVNISEESFIYTGYEIEPTITVKDNDHTLTYGTNYEVEYENNTDAGIATMNIKGIGIYSGTIRKNFIIKPVPTPENLPDGKIIVSEDTTSIGEITLPEGWEWEQADITLNPGRNTLKVIYLGDKNHDRYEFEIVVIRGEDNENTPSPTPDNPSNPNNKPNTGDNNNNQNNSTPDEKTPNENNNNQNTNSSTNPPKEEVPNTYDHILSSVTLLLLSILTLGLSTKIIKIKKVS